jgi:glyoxylase-like metal-dependent hydrolase (beta-lactamase superfamily II)
VASAIRHLNCMSVAPALTVGGRVMPARMVGHCLLLEGGEGLTLVDTGFGTADLAERRMGRAFIKAYRPALDPAETAIAQLRSLGYEAADVTDIVLTHLDVDHAGGLGDLPQARVHVSTEELVAATTRAAVRERSRYVEAQTDHGPRWVEHAVAGEHWFGFDAVQVLTDVLLVSLPGHTRGHCGVAVRRPSGGWLLHAGDAYFSHHEKERPPSRPLGVAAFEAFTQMDPRARRTTQDRIRALHAEHGPDSAASPDETVTIFCAHDAVEYDALAGVTD